MHNIREKSRQSVGDVVGQIRSQDRAAGTLPPPRPNRMGGRTGTAGGPDAAQSNKNGQGSRGDQFAQRDPKAPFIRPWLHISFQASHLGERNEISEFREAKLKWIGDPAWSKTAASHAIHRVRLVLEHTKTSKPIRLAVRFREPYPEAPTGESLPARLGQGRSLRGRFVPKDRPNRSTPTTRTSSPPSALSLELQARLPPSPLFVGPLRVYRFTRACRHFMHRFHVCAWGPSPVPSCCCTRRMWPASARSEPSGTLEGGSRATPDGGFRTACGLATRRVAVNNSPHIRFLF